MTRRPSRWQAALAPGPECIPLERLDALTEIDRRHLETCARCRSELALWQQIDRPASAGEADDLSWIAGETERRVRAHTLQRPTERTWRLPAWAGIAAALVLVIGAALLWIDRAPPLGPVPAGAVLRTGVVDALAPRGDLDAPPGELRWTAVNGAAGYDVAVTEVDGGPVWSAATPDTAVAVPPDVRARAEPAKTLQWQVVARDAAGASIARSEMVTFRVRRARGPAGR